MKKLYILIIVAVGCFNLAFSQATAVVSFEPVAGAPAGFVDMELKVAFTGTPDAIGNSNFFFTVDPSKITGVSAFNLGALVTPYTNSIADNGGGVYSYNIVFPSASNGSGTPVIGIVPVVVGTLRFAKSPTATMGTTPITLDTDFTEIFDEDAPSPSQIPLGPASPGAIPLPIKLSKFDVRPFGGIKASDLRWTSVSEVNAAYFDIERSADGITFSNIGRTKATGNSNLAIDYNYIDRSLPTNRTGEEIYYYRLNMVDLDGTAEYSEVRSVRFDNNDEVIVKMGPNPTSNVISINMSAPSAIDTDAPANVYDAAGRLVTSKKVNTNGVTEIDLSNYPNAIYNISVEHNGKTYNNRIIKSN